MKKLFLFAAACVALVACNQKDNALNGEQPIEPKGTVTITAKVEISSGSQSPIRTVAPNLPISTTEGATINFHWEESDSVALISGLDTIYYHLVPGSISQDGKTANFVGEPLEDMTHYDVRYVGHTFAQGKAVAITANKMQPTIWGSGNEEGFTLNRFYPMISLPLTGDAKISHILFADSVSGESGYVNYYDLTFAEPVQLSASATYVYFIWNCRYNCTGLKFSFYDENNTCIKVLESKKNWWADIFKPADYGTNQLFAFPSVEVNAATATPSPKYVFKDGSTFTVKLESKDYANIISFKYNGNTSTFACTYVYNSAYTVDLTDLYGPDCICTKGTGNTFTFNFVGQGYLDYNADVTPATAVMRAGTNPEYLDFNLTQFKVNDVDIIDQITVSKEQKQQ